MEPIKPITKSWFVDACCFLAVGGACGLIAWGIVMLTIKAYALSIIVGICDSVIMIGPLIVSLVYAATGVEMAVRVIVGRARAR